MKIIYGACDASVTLRGDLEGQLFVEEEVLIIQIFRLGEAFIGRVVGDGWESWTRPTCSLVQAKKANRRLVRAWAAEQGWTV